MRRLAWLCSLLGLAGGWCSLGPARAATLPPGFTETIIADTWDDFAGVTFDEAGAVYAWDRKGRIWIIENDRKVSTPLLDISEEIGAWNDHGLLGVAFHPNFRQNGYIYLLYAVDHHYLFNFGTPSYDASSNEYYSATIGRIARYTARASDNFRSVDPASRLVLLGDSPTNGIPITYITHGVGSLVFGRDGSLLASCGDGAGLSDSGNDPGSYAAQALSEGILRPKENVGAFRAQMVDSLNGKILRMDPETGEGLPSNPFYDPAAPRAARSLVYALGFRNPFRFSRRPGTGSLEASAGQPGVLYIGDVGYFTWEEMDVCTGPGMNFGWPLFEGYSVPSSYEAANPTNADAPNPLFGTGDCTRAYFTFRDLFQEASLAPPAWPNPCDPQQPVPSSLPRFVHSRPVADWRHGSGPSRVGIFEAGVASTANIGAPESPVSGPQFGGSCSIGGTWYTGTAFPAQYRNTYFHGDLAGGWIKSFTFDASNRLVSIQNFAEGAGAVVGIAAHPTNGALYYLTWTETLRKITYNGPANTPPTAVASANLSYGPGPLTVQFTGSGSSDPEGQSLTYAWEFGDGSPVSTEPDPSHTFAPPAGVPARYDVRLTVTDTAGDTNATSLVISVNNTPPQIHILSPANGTLYSVAAQTVVNLAAEVTDAEQSRDQLYPEWHVVLHHNDHTHSDPILTNWTAPAVLAPEGCDGDIYFYRITLVVTDAAGLTNAASVELFPNCNVPPSLAFPSGSLSYTENAGPVLLDPIAAFTDADSANLAGGSLVVDLVSNGADEDRLAVRHEGEGAGQIGVSGDTLSYGGIGIGTWSGGGSGSAPLVVAFNAEATPEAAQALLRHLTYENVQELPSVLPRTLRAVATDGDGGTSSPVTLTITVTAVPDDPVVRWTNPPAIGYGTALGADQLNAVANVPGTFIYTPAAGSVLPAGEGLPLSVRFTPEDLLNYNATVASVRIDVVPAPLVITAEDKTKLYGAAVPVLTARYSGFVNGETAATLSTPVELATTATSNSPPGLYPITLSGGTSPNYVVSYVAGTLTVLEPVRPSLVWPSGHLEYVQGSGAVLLETNAAVSDPDTPQLGGGSLVVEIALNGTEEDRLAIQPQGEGPGEVGLSGQAVNYGGIAVGSWSGGTNGSSPLVVLLNDQATPEIVQAILRQLIFETTALPGSSPRTLRAVLDNGHGEMSLPAEMAVSIIAAPSPPAITWGAPAPIVYGTPLGASQLNASAGVPGTFEYSPAAGTVLHAGPARMLSVTFRPQDTIHYLPATASVALDVSPAPLVVTADDKTKVYGDALPVFTASYAGFVEGDSAASLDLEVRFDTPATAASAVGSYAITPQGAADSDYAIRFVAGTLLIVEAPLTIRAESKTSTYGEALPPFTFLYVGLVNGDTPADLDQGPSASLPGSWAGHAGVYPIAPGGASSGNYEIAYQNGELTVRPAALTIRADDQSKGYLEPLPELTATYSGFVNGDTPASLDRPAALMTSASETSPPGVYPITVDGASDNDYVISYVDGTLTVTPVGLELSILELSAAGDVLLRITAPPGSGVDLEESLDLITWAPRAQVSVGTDPLLHWDAGGGRGAQKFYRLRMRE